MFDRLADFEAELDRLESTLADLYAAGDQRAAADAGRRASDLRPVVEAYRAYRVREQGLSDAREMLESEKDPEMRDFLRDEVGASEKAIDVLEQELKELLIPKDPNDGKNVIVEIRGGEGGDEGNIWAGDLYSMYLHYAEARRWKTELLSSQASDMGGFREVTFMVKGADAWSRLKHEAGPHRVQRVPATESQGRIHTSAATVAILPEAEEVDVHVDPNDLIVDVYRSSGPGGQSVNTTDSAVRLTHKPTGLVVTCQDEKSQLQNRDKAMRILRARLLQIEEEKREAELSTVRRSQLKGGGRSEKIRTYNFKENRVTDHRVGLTLHSLDAVLAGDLDALVDALASAERAEQLAHGTP
ncbi:MAG: peptide chain release factor 1 [Actinobacteria bacterium]|nr:peptide chain release factor 1 [Actinomycetota bacterium]MSZ29176.1 peptide chain release factor 1 [Actinomycetota bacterium]